MARVALDISDSGMRLTLGVMLQSEGHQIAGEDAQVMIADSPAGALRTAATMPSLVLTAQSGIPQIIEAMRQGVYGYILLPLQPGEAGLMVSRAASGFGVNTPAESAREEAPATLAEAERRHIETVLRLCKGNQVRAARMLDIGRNTLWRKMKSWKNGAEEAPPRFPSPESVPSATTPENVRQ